MKASLSNLEKQRKDNNNLDQELKYNAYEVKTKNKKKEIKLDFMIEKIVQKIER